jgi:hypothetical protein
LNNQLKFLSDKGYVKGNPTEVKLMPEMGASVKHAQKNAPWFRGAQALQILVFLD